MKYYRHKEFPAQVSGKADKSELYEPTEWEFVHVLPDWVRNTPETRPPVDEAVLVIHAHYGVRVDIWDTEDGWLLYLNIHITHWMPCPDLPEKDKPKRIEKLQIDNSLSVVQRSTRSKINEIIDRVEGEK